MQPADTTTKVTAEAAADAGAENVRLVVWDLDETFWRGTLTEGGIEYQRAAHDIVIELARRGIISSICSKNTLEDVQAILTREGLWDYFVFPSINWEPKGARLAALVADMQLRAPSVLFIDDNALNRAEAQHCVPGLQVADETLIARLLADRRFAGKADPEMTRLAQYRLLERRRGDAASGSDASDFLRRSNVRVTIEHDLEPHIDRAIELINRTNQLNFTKTRLKGAPDEVAAQLRHLLAQHPVQAGILHVRDNYGDHGYCGLYIMRSSGAGKQLLHFCFSCRILGMGVETWLYQRLGRPDIKIKGEVLANITGDAREIDWVRLALPDIKPAGTDDRIFDYIYARGNCDLHAVMHYFDMLAKNVYTDFNTVRDGGPVPLQHSIFAHYAIAGIRPAALKALEPLGFRKEDFTSAVTSLPREGRGFWLLSFWGEAQNALWKHRETGAFITGRQPGALNTPAADPEAERRRLYLLDNFEPLGLIGERRFKKNLTELLALAPASIKVFILKMDDERTEPDKRGRLVIERNRRVNDWTEAVATGYGNVELLQIRSFVNSPEEIREINHFDRMVYFRIFQYISKQGSASF
jgi:FkbH-like protein